MGYFGIFFLMGLESSFFPFPSEIIMIPAGYLAYQGKMNFFLVVLTGILGAIVGSWFNYFLANKFGRRLFLRFLGRGKLRRVEDFFEKHGHISTFNGRLIPVVRQYISLPAGFARMHFGKFTFYTGLGAGIWVLILTLLGYFLGQNEDLVRLYLKELTLIVLILVLLGSIVYVWSKRRHKAKTL